MHVTIIMSVFNGASTLERSLKSIMMQSFKDWDLVVVDDASMDNSLLILKRFASLDPRITILENKKNHGLAFSLNRAWRMSQGNLIARMDADDISLPTRLAQQSEYLLSHPEISVIGTGVILIDKNGTALGTLSRPESNTELVSKMYRETPFFHPTVMMRRCVLEDLGGYDERFTVGQDSELWLRAYKKFQFHNLKDPLLCYHLPQSLSPKRVYWAMRVILTAAYREDLMFSKGWYALRTLAAACLRWLGFRRAGLNFVRTQINLSELGANSSL